MKRLILILVSVLILGLIIAGVLYIRHNHQEKTAEATKQRTITQLQTVISDSSRFESDFFGTSDSNFAPNSLDESKLITQVDEIVPATDQQDMGTLNRWIKDARAMNQVVCQCIAGETYAQLKPAYAAEKDMEDVSSQLTGRIQVVRVTQ